MNKTMFMLLQVLFFCWAIKAMEPPKRLPVRIIPEYSHPEVFPTVKGGLRNVPLFEEYIPPRSFFELFPPDIVRSLAQPYASIDAATEKMREVLSSSPQMRELSNREEFTNALIKELAQKFYDNISIESQIGAAIKLNTDGAREFLKRQTDFLLNAKAMSVPANIELAKAIIESKADVNIGHKESRLTPLAFALKAAVSNPELTADYANFLLDKGAKVRMAGLSPHVIPDLAEMAKRVHLKAYFSETSDKVKKKKSEDFNELEKRIMNKAAEEARMFGQ